MDLKAFAVLGCTIVIFITITSTAGNEPAAPTGSAPKCGKPQTPPSKGFRIVGGGAAQNNSWPWVCALVQEIKKPDGMTYRQFCDCTLIDKEWVVTAAHCLEGLTPAQFNYYVKVYVGVEDLTKAMHNSAKKYNISQTIKHEGFVMKTKHNDIAVIKLQRAVEKFDNDTMPACLPTRYVGAGDYVQTSGPYNRKLCYVGGWGHTYEGESGKKGFVGSGSDKLKQTSTEIFAQVDCKRKLPVTESMFCAGYEQGGRDTCQGDSGGPLVCDDGNGTWVLHGIVSWGPGCARAGSPGVYTNVFHMKEWIKSKTGKDFDHVSGSSDTDAAAAATETTPLYEGRFDGAEVPIV